MCNKPAKITLYVLAIIFMFLGGILFIMYQKSAPTTWNETAIQTVCTINDTIIIQHSCIYPCMCQVVNCYTCMKSCYDMILILNYMSPNDTLLTSNLEVAVNAFDISSLNSSYAMGTDINCYYNSNHWWDVRLSLENLNKDFLVGAIVLWVLGGFILVVLLIIDIVVCLRW
jgi:hypothetical protein